MTTETLLKARLDAALNKLAKWRMVFAGWQLGTRSKEDPECQAVRDHRELSMLMRAEVSAIINVLVNKNIVKWEDFAATLLEETEALDKAYESKFPGFKSDASGMLMDPTKAAETTKGWRQ